MESIVNWKNTRKALNDFMQLLKCSLCDDLLTGEVCSFQICGHVFCKSCALELVNDTKPCPLCGTVLWKEHLQESITIPEVISICRRLKQLICKDDENGWKDRDGTYEFPSTDMQDIQQVDIVSSDSETENTCEEKQCKVANGTIDDQKIESEGSTRKKLFSNSSAIASDRVNSNLDNPLTFVNSGQPSIEENNMIDQASVDENNDYNSNDDKNVDSPPMSSQFSNVITKSESRKGIQKNPRRLLKKPKVTYGGRPQRHKQASPLKAYQQRQTIFAPKQPSMKRSGEEFDVFEFQLSGKEVDESGPSNAEVSKKSVNENNHHNNNKETTPSSPRNTPSSPSLNVHRNRRKRRTVSMAQQKKPKRFRNVSDDEIPPQKENEETTKKQRPVKDRKKKIKKVQMEKKNRKGETALHTACIKGNLIRVKELLEQGAQSNTKDFAGWTPLHEASSHGFPEIVELLLQYGAIIDTVAGDDLDTPLHDAVSNNRSYVVKILLQKKAPVNIRNRSGLLPIDYAPTDEMKRLLSEGVTHCNIDDEERFNESSSDEQKVFVMTNLNQREKASVRKCCKNLGAKILEAFVDTVTHIICGVDDENLSLSRTMKYWYGILSGKWLVSCQWILDSEKEQRWIREVEYEVKGTLDSSNNIPRRARINTRKMLPKLFEGCSFYLSGEFDRTLSKETVGDLVKLGGGKLLLREPKANNEDPRINVMSPAMNRLHILPTSLSPIVVFHAKENSAQACCTQYIIYDEKKSPAYTRVYTPLLSSTTVSWLLDCISNFEIIDIRDKHEDDFDTSQG